MANDMAPEDSNDARTRRLIARVWEGDKEALNELFATHEDYLRQVVEIRLEHRLRRRVSVADVVQATQIDALEHIDEYLADEAMPFHWWLRRTARDRLWRVRREHVETAKRDVRREVPLPDRSSLHLFAQLRVNEASPGSQVGKKEAAEAVRRALALLEDTDREVLLMRTFENLPYSEIAYVLEISEPTARKRFTRALVRLAALLRGQGLTESVL